MAAWLRICPGTPRGAIGGAATVGPRRATSWACAGLATTMMLAATATALAERKSNERAAMPPSPMCIFRIVMILNPVAIAGPQEVANR